MDRIPFARVITSVIDSTLCLLLGMVGALTCLGMNLSLRLTDRYRGPVTIDAITARVLQLGKPNRLDL